MPLASILVSTERRNSLWAILATVSLVSALLAPPPLEPFGLSVVEAMSHGLAVVAAAGGAHVETVGTAGILFPAGDVEAAARALSRLADDPTELAAMGAALRYRQQEHYSLALHVDRLEALYRSVTAGEPGQPESTARS